MIKEAIKKVINGESLSRKEAYETMNVIMSGEATPAQIAAFLVAEHLKGETYQEVAGFAESMRKKATPVPIKTKNAVDMCGTGGDGAGTFNISTLASFVVAGGGIPVAKHGNRSVSSLCGSADLFEKLGINLKLTAEQIGQCIDEVGIGFLFAPALHPAMKYAIGPRRDIAVRTVFNILGPITNPAGVKRQVVGAFNSKTAELIANVLKELGSKHILAIHGDDGLDEVSIFAPTQLYEMKNGKIKDRLIAPEDFGLTTAKNQTVIGGSPDKNLQIALDVLKGTKGLAKDFVVANAACGFIVGGLAEDFAEGALLAGESIDSGNAYKKVEALKEVSNSFA